MSKPTIVDVRQALADAVASIPVLQRCTPYLTDSINPPCGAVLDAGVDYDVTFGRGLDEWNYTVRVYHSRNAEIAAYKFFDTLREPVGASSLKTVVEADAGLTALLADVSPAGEPAQHGSVDVQKASEVLVNTEGQVPLMWVEFTIVVTY